MSERAAEQLTRETWCIVIGRVTRPTGLNGELRVKPLTDRIDRFDELDEVALFPVKGPARAFELLAWRTHAGWLYLTLAGVTDIESAEALRDSEIRIRRDMRYELEEGAYWVEDLVGMAVETEDGVSLGTISEVLQYPANDVYVTEHCLIPAIRDLMLSVDVAGRKMIVRAMPGLCPELGI